ncbi:MAG: type II restriction endonuclease [Blastocatellia bacterium]
MIQRSKYLFLLLCLLVFTDIAAGQKSASAKAELGSKTAKDGFNNETEIAGKFNNWRADAEAKVWLAAMGHKIADVESVAAIKPHGEKSDVQVRVKTKTGETVEGISIKLVSSPHGFNQIDKRWLGTYAKLWKMPPDVVAALKLFVGEAKPFKPSKDPGRMYLAELDAAMQKSVVDFFTANRSAIVSDIFEGDGDHAAKWFLVALKSTGKTKWVLRSSADAASFFGDGPISITRAGNLKIGRITMQRKGGDGGRVTAKMLQFKINPALLFDSK